MKPVYEVRQVLRIPLWVQICHNEAAKDRIISVDDGRRVAAFSANRIPPALRTFLFVAAVAGEVPE